MSWRDSPTTNRSWETVWLDELRAGIREEIGPYSAGRLELRVDQLMSMSATLTTAVLCENLPVERVCEQRREIIQTARFATWWDHFKATYRGRWWMRWRRWTVRQLVDEHELEATAVVDLQRYWTYPRAALPIQELGQAVRVMTYERVDEPGRPAVTRFLRG